jgi:Zn-dependent protease with chaperone function
MSGLGMWIVGVLTAVLGFVGLLLAAGSHGGPMYLMGLLIFAAAAAFVFWLIKSYFDQQEGH